MIESFHRIIHLDSVDSTNRYCADLARAGESEGLVVVARSQVAGRGRQGRMWRSPPDGSLLCSFLFRPIFGRHRANLCATIVSLGAIDAMRQLGARGHLKWPNDVVISDRKVAGVLGEILNAPSNHTDKSSFAVVVGIGINCEWPPNWADEERQQSELVNATTLARETGKTVSPSTVLELLLPAVEQRYRLVTDGRAVEQIMDEYRAACSTIGEQVRVELANGSFEALAVGLADDGRLRVERDGEQLLIEAGDVVHLRVAN